MTTVGAFAKKTLKSVILNRSSKWHTIGSRRYRMSRFFDSPVNLSEHHEPWSNAVYSAALATRDGTFVDVGVNVGQTLRRLLAMDPDRSYLGFEPQLDCLFYVQQFLEQNSLRNHTVLPIGLSNEKRVVKLMMRAVKTDQTASTIQGFRPSEFYARETYICVATGDSVVKDIGINDIGIVKIDTEGAELEVVEGFSETLQKRQPILLFEVLNHYLAATGQPLSDEIIRFRNQRNIRFMSHLQNWGYRVFNIRPDARIIEISKFFPPKSPDLRVVNHIAISTSDAENFFKAYAGTVTTT